MSTVFDVDIVFAVITATFLAAVDQSNSCMLIGWFGLIAAVSYDCALQLAYGLHGICLIRKVM